ncbi:hypothetical protein PVK06_025273 [Gossypium arboreum]|uniref:Uncharacterized protein n=1 Tax=Gossypium arboreum TaxID=29729 RepID=A0ABR0PGE5_GOSAR|nr:hypothetical protein PVK06_025273 [Gossypium arboreum]
MLNSGVSGMVYSYYKKRDKLLGGSQCYSRWLFGVSNSVLVRQIKQMLQYKEHWIRITGAPSELIDLLEQG